MKKVFALTLLTILFISLTACSPKDEFDTAILPEYDYVLNEQQNGLGNIPFEEYLSDNNINKPTRQKIIFCLVGYDYVRS
ncbi:MAG: hypothetical protein K2O08_04045 [Clostridia bacterium]|nr:hypothetical protein [Clostridia bacterium]